MCIQRMKAQAQEIEFKAIYEGFDDEPFICTDEERMMQVLLGLQSNALKFTSSGFVRIFVKLIDENESKFIQISVQDSGVGISKEDQKKLFKLFGFLAHNQKMNTKGVGLGLVIGKMITEKFDGAITLESTVGVGSTFTFKFKLEQEQIQSSIGVQRKSGNVLNSESLVFTWVPENPIYDVRYHALEEDEKVS